MRKGQRGRGEIGGSKKGEDFTDERKTLSRYGPF